jgi:hypothetical protein
MFIVEIESLTWFTLYDVRYSLYDDIMHCYFVNLNLYDVIKMCCVVDDDELDWDPGWLDRVVKWN